MGSIGRYLAGIKAVAGILVIIVILVVIYLYEWGLYLIRRGPRPRQVLFDFEMLNENFDRPYQK